MHWDTAYLTKQAKESSSSIVQDPTRIMLCVDSAPIFGFYSCFKTILNPVIPAPNAAGATGARPSNRQHVLSLKRRDYSK
jgi:hypothetical protein